MTCREIATSRAPAATLEESGTAGWRPAVDLNRLATAGDNRVLKYLE